MLNANEQNEKHREQEERFKDPSHAAFLHYSQNKSIENYINFLHTVAKSTNYSPYSYAGYKETVNDFYVNENFIEAEAYLRSVIDNYFFNSGVHMLLSLVLAKLGKKEGADFEYELAMTLLEGVLSTGDGSKNYPYLVLSTSDEYDVIEHLDKNVTSQRLLEEGEKYYDVLECEDGTQKYFDITIPYASLLNTFNSNINISQKKKWWKFW